MPPRHGNANMNMSMDKPMALHSAEGTRGPQVENAKMRSKKRSPRHGDANMNMSMDKPITLHLAEGTRGPQVEKGKNDSKSKSPGHLYHVRRRPP